MLPKLSVAIAVLSILSVNSLFGQGKDVKVMLHQGRVIEGELLCVQGSSVVVAVETGSHKTTASALAASVMRIPNSQIAVVTVEGNSHAVLGLCLGTLGGMVVGAVIGASKTEEPKDILGAVVQPMVEGANITAGMLYGGLGGMVLGTIIGGAASTKEQKITKDTPGGFTSLSQYARYAEGEPEFLHSVPYISM